MKQTAFGFALALVALIVSACGSTDTGGATRASTDGEWVLESLVVDEVAIGLPERSLDLRIDGDEIRGDAGCNSMGGSATFGDDGAVEIRELFWTEMACSPSSVMAFEQQYTQAFLAVTNWSLVEDRLTLAGDGVEAVYGRRVAPPDLPLIATVWTPDTFFDGDVAMNAAGMSDVQVVFSEGSVRVSGVCWTISGSATIEPGGEGNLSTDFTSADPDFTCDDRSLFDEMVERLSAVNDYRIDESRLTLGSGGSDHLSLRG